MTANNSFNNALDKRGKIFCLTTYLETKSFKTVPKQMQPINIGCLNIHGTHVNANNLTNNNVFFFFVSDLNIVYYSNN